MGCTLSHGDPCSRRGLSRGGSHVPPLPDPDRAHVSTAGFADEHSEYKWISIDEIPEESTSVTKAILEIAFRSN